MVSLCRSPWGTRTTKLLAAQAFGEHSQDIAVTSTRGPLNAGELSTYRQKLKSTLAQEIGSSPIQKAIFSSEDLSRLRTAEEVQRALELISSVAESVKVVVFLRRQDLLASSRYYSLVLGGSKEQQVLPTPDQPIPPYYDYAHNIGLWIDAIGADNLIAIRFPETPRAESFNSVVRFCASTGLNFDRYAPVQSQHVSYDAVNQIIIQNYNVVQGSYDHQKTATLLKRLADTNDSRYAHIVSARQAEQFYSRFRDANARLFERLGAPQEMFGEDFSMYPEKNMRQEYQARAIRRLLRLM